MSIYKNLAVVGMFRQEKRYDLIANNLGNVQTAGYKKDVPVFQKILSEALLSPMDDPVESVTIFQQGDLQATRNELDLAIEGEGFFKVKTPSGVRYTRNGNLRLNKDGVLIQSNGYPVLGSGREITVQGGQMHIGAEGEIWANGNNQGKIDLITFRDLKALKKEGQNLFKLETEQDEMEAKGSRIHQGALELSNVNALEEMVRMIEAMRTSESCHKAIQVEDDMNARAVNDLARV